MTSWRLRISCNTHRYQDTTYSIPILATLTMQYQIGLRQYQHLSGLVTDKSGFGGPPPDLSTNPATKLAVGTGSLVTEEAEPG